MKRWIGTVACVAVAGAAWGQMAARPGGLTNYPTLPAAVPFHETVFGTAIDDPYRWMEDEARLPEVQGWLRATSTHTRGELSALPGYAALKAELMEASQQDAYVLAPRPAGGRLFYVARPRGAEQTRLMVREAGRDRLLFDPASGGDATRAMGRFSPSPDGRLVAVMLSTGGGEVGELAILDAATGRMLPDRLRPTWGDDTPQWLGNDALSYVRLSGTSGMATTKAMTAYLHRLGRPQSEDRPVVGNRAPDSGWAVSEDEAASLPVDPSEHWTVAVASSAREQVRVAVAPTADVAGGTARFREIAGYADKVIAAGLDRDTFYYVSTRARPDGELRALDLADPNLGRSRLLLGGAGVVLRELAVGTDGVYVTAVHPHGETGLWYVRHGASRAMPVAVPAGMSANDLASTNGVITVNLVNDLTSDTHYRLVSGRLQPLGLASPTPPALIAGARVRQEWAVSEDGTRVPLSLMLPAARFTGPRPTILAAYGAYGSVQGPGFGPVRPVWVRHGGVYATCHVRGGGELGSAWHEAGQLASKVRGQEDLIACARRLIALGLATPATLGTIGTSAGGLLVPPAALRHPELFAAVVSNVAVVNGTRLAQAENGALQFAEFGDPRTEAGFRALAEADSALLLPRTRGGPDFMFNVGLNDHRVAPWISAKVAAMMRSRWGDAHLALIRSDDAAGHGHGTSREVAIAQVADQYAFFLNRFGAPGFVR